MNIESHHLIPVHATLYQALDLSPNACNQYAMAMSVLPCPHDIVFILFLAHE